MQSEILEYQEYENEKIEYSWYAPTCSIGYIRDSFLAIDCGKYLPLRYFAMDGQSDLPKKTQLEENIKLNMGKIVPTIDIKRMETVHPTVFYYLRSSKWVAIRNVILKEKRMVFSIRSILESFIRCINLPQFGIRFCS